MSRVYVLGAGFSNQVAGLPTVRDLRESFQVVLSRSRKSGHENRVFWGESLLGFLHSFEYIGLATNQGDCVVNSNVAELFEELLTFLDLNTRTELKGQVRRNGSTFDMSHVGPFFGYDAQFLRKAFETYMYLALEKPRCLDSTLLEGFSSQILADDTMISFNYDLVLERDLYFRGLWYPRDGYGYEAVDAEAVSEAYRKEKSSIPILKLHGSLNWQPDDVLGHERGIRWFFDDNGPIFPGYLSHEKPVLDEPYQGGHHIRWLLPSFVKALDDQRLLAAWRQAALNLREKPNEVVVIGYSLPVADPAAWALFASSCHPDSKLIVVDKNAEEVVQRFVKATGCQKYATYLNLESYLLEKGG